MVDNTYEKSTLRVVESLAHVSRSDWQSLAGLNPFVSYDFLRLLEASGCASTETGWSPRYLLVEQAGQLVGATAAYLKTHSRGEFVFDHSWAQAFERYGVQYYPKLVVSVPFTPVSGPRLLARDTETRSLLAQALVSFAHAARVSSVHALFIEEADRMSLSSAGFMLRDAVQFHWTNAGYKSFDEFLAVLSHDKRKKLKQDRKYVARAGITYRHLTGPAITEKNLRFFYSCYANTYKEHWSSPYLTLEFFLRLHELCPTYIVLVLAEREGKPVACALNIRGGRELYGRYWGTTEFISGLHFETCYAQSIEYCINEGISAFEGGAQGEHKIARGLLPVKTYSAHWIADERFASAIHDFLEREREAVESYTTQLGESSPYRREEAD